MGRAQQLLGEAISFFRTFPRQTRWLTLAAAFAYAFTERINEGVMGAGSRRLETRRDTYAVAICNLGPKSNRGLPAIDRGLPAIE